MLTNEKNNNPLISIIIPVYNIDKYIARCLDSVINQSYTNLEIIVVNDGSTDETLNVLNQYLFKDSRIKIINKENEGVSKARNTGIDNAKGDYIGFVDGDDVIEKDMYKTLLELMIKYNASISHCGYQMVFPDRIDKYYGTEQLKIQNNFDGVKDLIEGKIIEPGTCNKLYHKKILSGIRFNSDIRINEDLLFNYYAFSKSLKSVFLDIPFYNYMIRKGSASTSKWNENKIMDPIKVVEEMISTEKNQEIKNILKEKYVYQLFRLSIFYSKDDSKNLKEYRKYAQNKLKNELSKFNKVSKKIYWMAMLSSKCPFIMYIIHEIHGCINGSKNKYKV